jgi:hypothetical protein
VPRVYFDGDLLRRAVARAAHELCRDCTERSRPLRPLSSVAAIERIEARPTACWLLAQLDVSTPTHVNTMFTCGTRAVEDATDNMHVPWHNHSLREEHVCLF